MDLVLSARPGCCPVEGLLQSISRREAVPRDPLGHAEIVGFSFMFLGFSLIFVGVKRFRDRALGGEIRPRGLDARTGLPLAYVQFIVAGRVWCELLMEFALFDATPFVRVPLAAREAFLRHGAFHPLIRFSSVNDSTSEWNTDEARRYQWMPRQLETVFGLPEGLSLDALTLAITAREHVGHALSIHPATISVDERATVATTAHLPLQGFALNSSFTSGRVRISTPAAAHWLDEGEAGMFRGEFLRDVSRALRRRYVRHFRDHSPAATAAWRGRPVII
eukprot:gene34092-45707_t